MLTIQLHNHKSIVWTLLLGIISCAPFTNIQANLPDSFWEELGDEKVYTYIQKYQHIAIAEMDRMGIPASIKMAQGILESGSGLSQLAQKGNNHFGIKCGGKWDGDTYYAWDDEEAKSCFRVYESAEECYIAHSEFLTDPKKDYRYGPLFELEKTDYKGWANGLQKAGYATSKTYAKKLISVIERYELFKLDYLTTQMYVVTDEELERELGIVKEEPLTLFDQIRQEDKDSVNTDEIIIVSDPLGSGADIEVVNLTLNKFKINELNAVFVQPGDDIQKVAKRYKYKDKKLSKYNELPAGTLLKPGRYIFLEKKAKKYEGLYPTYLCKEGESLWEISQRYGVRVKWLQKLNPKYKKTNPPKGTRIFLKI